MARPSIDIAGLSPEERLRLIEDLWESLRMTRGALPLTGAQREELDRRLDEVGGDGADGIPWDEVLREIRRRRE